MRGWLGYPEIFVLVGLGLLSVTQVMYMFLSVDSPLWLYIVATAIMGAGNALFQSPNNTMVMSSVTIENLGLAGSMNSFARNLGMVIGISLSTTVLYQAMSAKMGQRVTNYIADRPRHWDDLLRPLKFLEYFDDLFQAANSHKDALKS